MTVEPIALSFAVGKDAYGRSVTLHRRTTYDGKQTWEIVVDAFNQRDDTQRITGLSTENLRVFGEIYAHIERKP